MVRIANRFMVQAPRQVVKGVLLIKKLWFWILVPDMIGLIFHAKFYSSLKRDLKQIWKRGRIVPLKIV